MRIFPRRLTPLLLVPVVFIIVDLIGVMLPAHVANLRREQSVTDAIKRTEAFIIKTHGQWPRSWADLALNQEEVGWGIKMNFDIDPDKASMADVVGAIRPANGHYMFWHEWRARQGLEKVYSALCKARAEKPEPGVGADSR